MACCAVEGCEHPARVRGLCNKHRMRVKRYEERMDVPGTSFREARPEMEQHRKSEFLRTPVPGGED